MSDTKDVGIFVGTEPMFIIDDDFYHLEIMYPGKKLKIDTAYVIPTGLVLVYMGKVSSLEDLGPGIYRYKGEYKMILPSEEERHKYTTDKIYERKLNDIFKELHEKAEEFMDVDMIETINANINTFTPTIKEDDDFLKYLIKQIIIGKEINLKNYKDKFANDYALTNMKSGLSKATKMTVTNFKKWCEALGIRWTMIVEDSGDDKVSPLKEPIKIESEDF